MATFNEHLMAQLRNVLPADAVYCDADTLAVYGNDWTRVFPSAPGVVVMPQSTQEVAAVLRLCHEARVGVVPSGGRTGLSAGAVATAGEVVLSLERMRLISDVDVLGQTINVQAGAVTGVVHAHCAPHGLTWPVDFASKGSSQIGGNIATNAGGVKVIRYGMTRQWVLGLQVVTAQGEVLQLNGALEKNNTGADLRQLFIGSEGTLGVITEATLKLTPLPNQVRVMLFATNGLSRVLTLFKAARCGPFRIMAYEFFTHLCLKRVLQYKNFQAPFSRAASHYILLEVEEYQTNTLEIWMAAALTQNLVHDRIVANSSDQAAQLWALREYIGESLLATNLAHKNDIALPIALLEGFCAEMEAFFAQYYPGWEVCLFGHIGDGNLHVNVIQPPHMSITGFLERTRAVDCDLFKLVCKHKGSISAEHGIGLLKKDFLSYSRSPQEIALLKALKTTLDPHGILNPGKIF